VQLLTQQRLARRHEVVAALTERMRGRFSAELGLTLVPNRPKDLFLWFLAALLYGTRISGTIVAHTHAEFVRRGLVTPEKILKTGWDGLVVVLDAGGYARYDFKTATKLLEVTRHLVDQYDGDLNQLHRAAKDARDLENRLTALGKGIGQVTVQIFLRELRDLWLKARPELSPLAVLAAKDLRLLSPAAARRGGSQAEALMELWDERERKNKTFGDFESALVRLGRGFCRRRWQACPMCEYCGRRGDPTAAGKGTKAHVKNQG
jgi:endonuclease III